MDQNEKTSVKPEKTTAFKCELAEMVKAVKEAMKHTPHVVPDGPDILDIMLQLCEHVENLEDRLKALESGKGVFAHKEDIDTESFDAGIMKIIADACGVDISDVTYETEINPSHSLGNSGFPLPHTVLTQIEYENQMKFNGDDAFDAIETVEELIGYVKRKICG